MSDHKLALIPSAPASGPRLAALAHEDYAEVLGVVACYGRFYDDDRIDDFIGLLTEDAVFHPNWPGVAPEYVSGRAALKEFFGGARAQCNADNIQPRHYTTNVVVCAATADSAEVTASMAYAESTPGGNVALKMIGQYDWVLVKRDGRWSIARWSMRYDK